MSGIPFSLKKEYSQMKVLIITATFPPEPVVSSYLSQDIAFELAIKNEVTVLCPRPTRPFGYNFEDNKIIENQVPFKRIQLASFTSSQFSLFERFRESYSIGKSCARYIKKSHSNIDVIYVNTWPIWGQFFVVQTAKYFNLPVIIHVQDIYPESLMGKLPVLKKLVFRLLLPYDKYIQQNAAKVITISENMRSLLIKTRKLKASNVEVIYNWQNEYSFINYRERKNILQENTPFTFMFLGSLNATAAVYNLINAFGKSDLKNARLVIAGNGPEKVNLISLAKAFQNAHIEFWDANIQCVPEIQDHANVLLLNLCKGAAQFAMPSKLPAYMFSQKPVIAAVDENSDIAQLIINADCGWIVPPENIERLADAMRNATLNSPDTLKILGENGFNYAMKYLSKTTNLTKIIQVIENIVIK